MADMTIDEATRVSSVTGGEVIPCSASGNARALTAAQAKDYVLKALAELTADDSAFATGANPKIEITRTSNGVTTVKPMTFGEFSKRVIATASGLEGLDSLSNTDKFIVNGTYTVTWVRIKTELRSYLENDLFYIHGLPDLDESEVASHALETSDETAISRDIAGAPTKYRTTLGKIKDYILGLLPTFATEETSVATGDDILIVHNTAPAGQPASLAVRRVDKANLGFGTGDVTAPASTTENKVPQWDSTAKKLKNGLEVVNEPNQQTGSQGITSSCTDSQVATAAAVYEYGQTLVGDSQKIVRTDAETTTANNVPQWDSTSKKLKDGLGVVTTVRATASAQDTVIPTERAVANAVSGLTFVKGPVSASGNDIALFDGSTGKLIKDSGKQISGTVSSSSTANEVPTSQAVYDIVYLNTSTKAETSAVTSGIAAAVTANGGKVRFITDEAQLNTPPASAAYPNADICIMAQTGALYFRLGAGSTSWAMVTGTTING